MIARVIDLGRLPFGSATAIQASMLEKVAVGDAPHTLLYVEHPPVLTLGASFHESNLLLDRSQYGELGIEIHETGRGGDVTFHGPGQLVIYPIFRVSDFGRDLHRWIRNLEETVIVALKSFDIEGRRFPPHTGVWVGDAKIAAIGIKVRKWTSMHGIALNCDADLRPFEYIVPCGIKGYGVTSISRETGAIVGVEEARPTITAAFEEVFGIELIPGALS